MTCFYCKKAKIVMFELEAAAKVKDKELQKKLDEEGRGAAAGPLIICRKCYAECYEDRKEKEAA